jgi:hypothetical protein
MGDGTTNRSFATQLRSYELSFTPGTAEYRERKDYPGEALRGHTCSKPDCVAYDGPLQWETYWICPECAALAPCAVSSYRNAPYKVLPPPKKRKQASAVCLSTYFRRRRGERLEQRALRPRKSAEATETPETRPPP